MCIWRKVIAPSLSPFPLFVGWTCCWPDLCIKKTNKKESNIQSGGGPSRLKDYESLNDLLVHCCYFPRTAWPLASGLSYDTAGVFGVSFAAAAQFIPQQSSFIGWNQLGLIVKALLFFVFSWYILFQPRISNFAFYHILVCLL